MRIDEQPKLATVFGGSGFVGRHVVRALANRGWRVRVAVRRPHLAFHLQPVGNLGQIKAVQANLRYRASVERACKGANCVINLVGILKESGRQNFAAVQELGARTVAEGARSAGARLIHVSSIGADIRSPSAYARSKGRGERAALAVMPKATILRPSIIFGPQDDFFNRFGRMAQISPVLPLIGGGATRFQPVFVGDVAEAIALGAAGKIAGGRIFELGGPEIVSFRQCMEKLLEVTGRRRLLVNLPFFLAKAMARLTGWLPGAPLTYDQVLLLQTDNVVSREAIDAGRTLEAVGIAPKAMAAVLPTYLVRFRPQGQFTRKGEV